MLVQPLISRELSAYIRYKLYKKGISHRDFAQSIGISDSYFANLLRGSQSSVGNKAAVHVKAILDELDIKDGEWIKEQEGIT